MPAPEARRALSAHGEASDPRDVAFFDAAGATVGWDIGGAHVKACVARRGRVVDVAQWICPLWQGLDALEAALGAAGERWQGLVRARHAVTMTGEMVDLFVDREDGVRRIAACLARHFGDAVQVFAGDAGWRGAADAASVWQHVASANWLAAARHAALCLMPEAGGGRGLGRGRGDGLWIDIGSTTTDIVAFRGGTVLTAARTDAGRLASGELVYHGVVRTPLCALAPRIAWRGGRSNVMNELFATTADIYRLTAELDPAHDLYPPADTAGKDLEATRRRLARMIGLDAREASAAEWLGLARAWRAAQVAELAGQVRRVCDDHALDASSVVVASAGCGDFLVADVIEGAGLERGATRLLRYGSDLADVDDDVHGDVGVRAGTDGAGRRTPAAPGQTSPSAPPRADLAGWAQVCAPCVAVAALHAREHG